jgi:hypothetical protein
MKSEFKKNLLLGAAIAVIIILLDIIDQITKALA